MKQRQHRRARYALTRTVTDGYNYRMEERKKEREARSVARSLRRAARGGRTRWRYTGPDSDGGTWFERARGTSWARASGVQFPKQAVIFMDPGATPDITHVAIYDTTGPEPKLWQTARMETPALAEPPHPL